MMLKFTDQIKERIKRVLGKPTRISLFENIIPLCAVGAELGVFKGEFSEEILRYNKPEKLYLIDGWWTLYGEAYPDWGEYTENGKLRTRTAYQHVCRMAQNYPDTDTKIIVGDDRDVLQSFDDHYFDWVYIDTSHKYHHTMEELEILERKVKRDGLICGHDWVEDPENIHYGVYLAISEFCKRHNFELIYKDQYSQWVIKRK